MATGRPPGRPRKDSGRIPEVNPPPGYESGDIHDLLGEQPTVEEIVAARDTLALAKADEMEQRRILQEQADLAGMPLETVRMLALTAPDALATVISSKAQEAHQRQMVGDESLTRTFLGEHKDTEIAGRVQGLGPKQLAQMAAEMVPEDLRGKVQLLWDLPARDGMVYSYSFVTVAEVPKCLKKGMDVVPHGPLAPKPSNRCGMVLQGGGECNKMLASKVDWRIHREKKHPTALKMILEEEAEQRAQRQEKRAEASEQRMIDLLEQNRQLQERLVVAGLVPVGTR